MNIDTFRKLIKTGQAFSETFEALKELQRESRDLLAAIDTRIKAEADALTEKAAELQKLASDPHRSAAIRQVDRMQLEDVTAAFTMIGPDEADTAQFDDVMQDYETTINRAAFLRKQMFDQLTEAKKELDAIRKESVGNQACDIAIYQRTAIDLRQQFAALSARKGGVIN